MDWPVHPQPEKGGKLLIYKILHINTVDSFSSASNWAYATRKN